MGKSKKPNWGQDLDHHTERHHHHKDAHHDVEMGVFNPYADIEEAVHEHDDDGEGEWIEAEMLESTMATHYLDEAHDALARLSQKTNKRGSQLKRPHRSENWH